MRTVAPPSLVPKSMSQEPTRGATARRTARPPAAGGPEAERCAAPGSVVSSILRRALLRDPDPLINSWRCASAWECTAFAWIIIPLPRWTFRLFVLVFAPSKRAYRLTNG